jgi:mannitol-specific phosphotransferase system IIBC component
MVIGRLGAIAGPIVGGLLMTLGVAPDQMLAYLAAPMLTCAILIALVRKEWLVD